MRWAFLTARSQASEIPRAVNQKCFPSRCERDPLSLSLEQVDSEFPLQVLNLFAERRLRHVQSTGRVGKIQLLSSSDKVFQVAKFH
jgi:hypothetical protein